MSEELHALLAEQAEWGGRCAYISDAGGDERAAPERQWCRRRLVKAAGAGLAVALGLLGTSVGLRALTPAALRMPSREDVIVRVESCHTAEQEEPCYRAVEWAYYHGILDHPDWYPGLNDTSGFEELQLQIHRMHLNGCQAPCDTKTTLAARVRPSSTTLAAKVRPSSTPPSTPAPAAASQGAGWGHPSFFCFTVARGFNPEMDLVKIQRQHHAGIFACDEQAVLSSNAEDLGAGVHTRVISIVNEGGISQDGTAANTQSFVNAWQAIADDGRFNNHDFTVKVDPDTVLLPDRLRKHLDSHTGANVYFANCNMFPGSPNYPTMYGAAEVLSVEAVRSYFASGQRCQHELPWQSWGEDLFMVQCLKHLGVGQVVDTGIMQDMNCGGPSDCHNGWAAAFHHYKDTNSWLGCWETATR